MTNDKSPLDLIDDVLSQAGIAVVDGRRGRVLRSQMAVTTTLKVAEVFGKRHQHVLRAFDNLWEPNKPKNGPIRDLLKVKEIGAISGAAGDRSKNGSISDGQIRAIDPDAKTLDDFRQLNYNDTTYLDSRGRQQRMVIMTRKGFEFLTLGFTGRKAMMFRLAYIERFHEMDAELHRRAFEAANTAYRHPPYRNVTYDYGRGAIAVVQKPNPDAKPLPEHVRAIYNEDAELFETDMADFTRLAREAPGFSRGVHDATDDQVVDSQYHPLIQWRTKHDQRPSPDHRRCH